MLLKFFYLPLCVFLIGGTSMPPLLFTTQLDIRLASLANRSNQKSKVQILVRNLTEGVGLDFNYAAQKICWTDHGLEMIQCISYKDGEVENKVEVINSDLISPEGLACDWFTNKLYWTDSDTNKIEVATMEGRHRKVLIWSDIDQPRTIALVPQHAIMFWTDWGEVPKIERAGMNGDPSTRRIIVSENIFWPNGLTVDYAHELLYWIDGKLHFLDVMDFAGGNRRTLVKQTSNYPFALTMYQNFLYWTDWHTSYVYAAERNATTLNTLVATPKEFIHSTQTPMYIQVWDSTRQPRPKQVPCSVQNGNCSHLCLLAPNVPTGYTCACPIGIRLLNNYTCAAGPRDVLLYATRTDIYILYLDSDDYTQRALPLNDIKYTIAVDYEPSAGFVYWTDDEVKAIRRARLDGSAQTDVVADDIQHPDGIAVDWMAMNLYWTDTGTDRVEVCRMDGRYRRVLVHEGLQEPRAIVVAPEHGWLFWSDWSEKLPRIERAVLDGSERMAIVNTGLGWPNGLTLDLTASKVYWCDAKVDKIEVANMDGSDRMELISGSDILPHTFGLSLLGDYIYWTDWQRRAIDRVHKTTGSNRTTINDQVVNVMGLRAVRLNDTKLLSNHTNACSIQNGGCEHLCLNRPAAKYICACQMNYELRMPDKRACVRPQKFIIYARNHSIGRLSIEHEFTGNDILLPINGIRHASSLDTFMDDSSEDLLRVYWSDVKLHAIYRAFINGSDVQRVIDLSSRSSSNSMISDLVVIGLDWRAQNLYWTDGIARSIEVARLDGSNRRVLLWKTIEATPRALALDPDGGWLYWSEWDANMRWGGTIKRALLDGTQPMILQTDVGLVRCLTIDYETNFLYWTTGNNIERINLINNASSSSSLSREIIISNATSNSITAFTMHDKSIYYTDTSGNMWITTLKPSNTILYKQQLGNGISSLQIVHTRRRGRASAAAELPPNQCAIENGGCTNLCLASRCLCPTHSSYDNRTGLCRPPTEFMLYSQRSSVVRLLPPSTSLTEAESDFPEAVLPVQGLNRIKAIDFDSQTHTLYWIEGKTHSIKRALANGSLSQVTVVVQGGINGDGTPYDLAIDEIGRLLFWTCSTHNVINVTRLDANNTTQQHLGVVMRALNGGGGGAERPRLLALHARRRLLFWSDAGDKPRVVRARLDGSQRIDIVQPRPRQNITAIALDLDADMIVWAEGLKLYTCNIDGENKYSLVSESRATISQMAVHGGSLYWLERSPLQLRKLDLVSGEQQPIRLLYGTSTITDLVSIRAAAATTTNHSCSANNHCSHLCIDPLGLCACPIGLALHPTDRRTCVPVPECGRDHFTCGRNRNGIHPMQAAQDCIPLLWRCDGHPDCADASDESDCPTCRTDQFRCQASGDCIEPYQVCDGQANCQDGADELGCCSKQQEFKCPRTDVCISLASLCDGVENCADGADEADAMCTGPPHTRLGHHFYNGSTLLGDVGTPPLHTSSDNNSQSANGAVNGGTYVIALVFVCALALAGCIAIALYLRRRCAQTNLSTGGLQMHDAQASDPLNPKMTTLRAAPPDLVHMSMLGSSTAYERCHITGASSSTNASSSLGCYPRETLNPPPSPATTRASSPPSGVGHRPYRHYRAMNQPPPPTPCSTDVCDESDYGGNGGSGIGICIGGGGRPPPPPTPLNFSCPPSPSCSRSSTYFSPLPPPPSPAPSPLYYHQSHRRSANQNHHHHQMSGYES